MTIRFCVLVALVALVLFASAAQAQLPDDSHSPPVCTDLTGKVSLPCPTTGDTVTTLSDEEPADSPLPVATSSPKTSTSSSTSAPRREPAVVTAAAPPAASGVPPLAAKPAIVPAVKRATEPDPRAAIGFYPKTPGEPEPVVNATSPAPTHVPGLFSDFAADQKNFWTSPARLRLYDVQWLAPLVAGIGLSIGADTAVERHLPTSTNLQSQSKTFSDYTMLAFAGSAGGAFLLGSATHNDHLRETGFVSGEAILNSTALVYAIKNIANRDRPFQTNGRGNFFAKGDSFPSEHAAIAWSAATVIAHEYPGFLTSLFAYGGAAGVSAARVVARQHFASDAIVGSALGFFVGRQMYKAHAERIDRSKYGVFERSRADHPPSPDNFGSSFVPLDSWVYDAFDRLAALGYVHTAFAGLKPWTRMECLRLLDEAQTTVQASDHPSSIAGQLVSSLKTEFVLDAENVQSGSNMGVHLESIYTRFTGISGKPLTDGYHFGQTIINDYGRPYEEGFNLATGFSSRAEAGPLAFYVRGEYQHSPGAPALSDSTRQTIAAIDSLPVAPLPTAVAAVNRVRLLDAYVGLNLHNWQVSAGKQSLSWGPGEGGSMMLSDNIEPINMVRITRTEPIRLPSIFGLMGPLRTEFFLGQLSGYEFVQSPTGLVGQYGRSLHLQPYINGQKISFKPSNNLELGFSRTTIYGGPGYPLTEYTLYRSIFSSGNQTAGATNKAGDRRSGMDLSYKIPKLRNWLTFYADGFTDDEFSPVAYPDRSAWRAGLFLARVPHLPKLDLRGEGVYTDNPLGGALGHGFYYFNFTWHSGYTNNRDLIGSWIGRQGQGAQGWATYHFNSKNSLQGYFRHQKISTEFLPGGGTLADVGIRGDLWSRSGLNISSLLQYERWTLPALTPGAQSNISSSVQITFRPADWGKH